MKIIVGLGNPGEKYKYNRHNVGHMVADALASKIRNPKSEIRNKSEIKIFKSRNFMNDSGSFIKRLISQYPIILISDIYIVHDDLDIPLGSYKIQMGRGPKEHKGLDSINNVLGSKYWHVRVGVDNRDPNNRKSGDEYVLQDFTGEEKVKLEETIRKLLIDLIHLISK